MGNYNDFIFDVSIDRLTMVGDLTFMNQIKDEKGLLNWSSPFQKMFDVEECVSVISTFAKSTTFRVFDKVYVELHFSNSLVGRRQFRMDFNPNNLDAAEVEFLKRNILSYVKNASFTRVDVAYDCNIDLSEFVYIEKDPRKRNSIFGRSGKLETLYLGTRNSSKQVRIYNKNQESKDKQLQVDGETGEVAGVKFIPPVDKLGNEHPVWWRFEITFKRNEIDVFNAKNEFKSPFDGLEIVKPNYKGAGDVKERAMLFYLEQHPEERGNLNPRTRKKYDNLLLETSEVVITDVFKKTHQEKRADIQYSLVNWLSATQKKIKN